MVGGFRYVHLLICATRRSKRAGGGIFIAGVQRGSRKLGLEKLARSSANRYLKSIFVNFTQIRILSHSSIIGAKPRRGVPLRSLREDLDRTSRGIDRRGFFFLFNSRILRTCDGIPHDSNRFLVWKTRFSEFGSYGLFFFFSFRLRMQERHVSLFTAVPISSYLPLLVSHNFGVAKERGSSILDLGRRRGEGGEPPEFDRAYRTRALSPSCRSSLEICCLSVRPFDRSCLRSFVQYSFFAVPARNFLSRNGARSLRLRRNGMSRRDRPMRRYAVRSTGLLKARSKA